jgi:REP-associated tyrosine transposase
MVIGYHLIWTAYGWWLPNDPRGSSSHEIRVERIAKLGPLHFERKQKQPSSNELRQFFAKAHDALKYEPREFNLDERDLIGKAIDETIRDRKYTCYACAVMPEHVHLLIRRHRDTAEVLLETFQQASRKKLIEARSFREPHPVWGGPGWKVYVNTRGRMEATVQYIEDNPVRIGLPRQMWGFVTRYDGWFPRFRQ